MKQWGLPTAHVVSHFELGTVIDTPAPLLFGDGGIISFIGLTFAEKSQDNWLLLLFGFGLDIDSSHLNI